LLPHPHCRQLPMLIVGDGVQFLQACQASDH